LTAFAQAALQALTTVGAAAPLATRSGFFVAVQAGQDGSAAWTSASGESSDGRRPQGEAPGTMERAVAATGMEGNGVPDSAMTLSVPTSADGTVRWPAGTRLVDMFA
jgi:hypothetical protein